MSYDKERDAVAVRKYYLKNKESILAQRKCRGRDIKVRCIEAKGGVCSVCGYKYDGHNAVVFDFHHRDPTQKEFQLGHLVGRYAQETIDKELAKCDMVCSNCHRMIHFES